MRILLSSLLFILVGCASYPKKNGFFPIASEEKSPVNPYFSDTAKDYIYKARIEALGNTFSGILAIKKLGEKHHRLAFTTEMGNTIFDFTFKNGLFKINKILDKLDRKILLTILKRDFSALLTENPQIETRYKKEPNTLQQARLLGKAHYYLFENDSLTKIIRAQHAKEKVVISFSKQVENNPTKIQIAHKNIKLTIHLNAIHYEEPSME